MTEVKELAEKIVAVYDEWNKAKDGHNYAGCFHVKCDPHFLIGQVHALARNYLKEVNS